MWKTQQLKQLQLNHVSSPPKKSNTLPPWQECVYHVFSVDYPFNNSIRSIQCSVFTLKDCDFCCFADILSLAFLLLFTLFSSLPPFHFFFYLISFLNNTFAIPFLHLVLADNLKSNPGIKWQYFSSEEGIFTVFPAHKFQCKGSYEHRSR